MFGVGFDAGNRHGVRGFCGDVVEEGAERGAGSAKVVRGLRIVHESPGSVLLPHSTINFADGSLAVPRTHPMSDTVDPLVPLTLLEAVRSVDRPDDDLETEFVEELKVKRFGLSDTVHAQIGRYLEATKRGHRPTFDEAAGIARLIGRRTDAEAVFREAGRGLARRTYDRVPLPTRRLVRLLPAMIARPMALGQIKKVAQRILSGDVRRVGSSVHLEVKHSVTLDAGPKLAGCTYYEAVLRELMQRLVDGVGVVEHVRCASRGEGTCEWRAQWRA